MELKEFLLLIKHKRQTIILMIVSAIIAVAGISLLFPLRYEAQSRLLITQDTGTADAYTVSRSNEYLGNLFSQVARSSSFFDLLADTQYNVDQTYFRGNYEQKIKMWRSTVNTNTLSDSGIIEVKVYHPNPYQAQQIALAVNDILINKNFNYQGNGDRVKINVIDQPLVSSYPVKPNLIQNVILAALFSFIFALFYIYIFPEEEYSWRLFAAKKKHRLHLHQEKSINNSRPTDHLTQTASTSNHQFNNHQSENNFLHGNIHNILR